MMNPTPSSHYFGKKRKEKTKRILIPTVLILSILTVTLMLGNLLKDRLTEAESLLNLPAVTYPEQDTSVKTPSQLLLHKDKHTSDVRYTAWESGTPAPDFESLAPVYGGISVILPPTWTEAEEEDIRKIADEAAKHGMKVCAVFSLSDCLTENLSETLDAIGTRAEALDRMHAAEILITGITGEESILTLAEIPGKVRASAPRAQIGLGVTPEALISAPFAPALEVLAEAADFLALDGVNDLSAEDTADLAFRHRGSIRYFSLRVLIRGEESVRQSAEAALLAEGYTSLQMIP
jgi:hypothetical protein